MLTKCRMKNFLIAKDDCRLTIVIGKNCFNHFSTRMEKYYVLGVQILKNLIHQIDNKTKWLLFSASFTAKFGLVFVLTLENAFS